MAVFPRFPYAGRTNDLNRATRGRKPRSSHRNCGWAIRSRLAPVKKVAATLKRHLDGVRNDFDHRVTGVKAEAFNGRNRSIKSAARGFRRFEHDRRRTLFCPGKFNMLPEPSG